MNIGLKFEYGSIYKSDGSILEEPAMIINKETGISKYGEVSSMLKYYENLINKMGEDSEEYFLITFDKYNGVISAEEICTLINYLIVFRPAGERVMELLNTDKKNIKHELEKLGELNKIAETQGGKR